MVQDIVTYNNRIFNTTMVFLNHIHAIVTIRTKKGTMGQFGPMVLKYNKDFIMQYLNHKKEPSLKGSKGNKYV